MLIPFKQKLPLIVVQDFCRGELSLNLVVRDCFRFGLGVNDLLRLFSAYQRGIRGFVNLIGNDVRAPCHVTHKAPRGALACSRGLHHEDGNAGVYVVCAYVDFDIPQDLTQNDVGAELGICFISVRKLPKDLSEFLDEVDFLRRFSRITLTPYIPLIYNSPLPSNSHNLENTNPHAFGKPKLAGAHPL